MGPVAEVDPRFRTRRGGSLTRCEAADSIIGQPWRPSVYRIPSRERLGVVAGGDKELSGQFGADAEDVDEVWGGQSYQGLDLTIEGLDLGVEGLPAASEIASGGLDACGVPQLGAGR